MFRPASGPPGPAVVIAHGFAGSQQLMQSFAIALARAGYTAVTFDFLGHGRNPKPLAGDVTDPNGATRALVAQTAEVLAFARGQGYGRLALLGHSMASDIVVRAAEADSSIAATVAVSMFSPAVTAKNPRNLLIIAGGWEGFLKAEALRAVGQVAGPEAARDGVTYGAFADGTARRAAFAPGVEHIGVLFSTVAAREAVAWLDAAFGRASPEPPIGGRGPWIALLVAGVVLLARPASRLLPVVSDRPLGAGLPWRKAWPVVLGPALATPLILQVVPTDFLPVIVGDYLAAHFFLYGVLTALGLWLLAPRERGRVGGGAFDAPVRLAVAALMAAAFGVLGLGSAIDAYVTSFAASPGRPPLIAAMLAGTLCYFLANEWLTRGEGAGRGLNAASQALFLLSLALAVALDFRKLFFLLIIVPAIVLVLLIGGLIARWAYRRTGHPFAGAFGVAALFAWAIGVTFPMLAG